MLFRQSTPLLALLICSFPAVSFAKSFECPTTKAIVEKKFPELPECNKCLDENESSASMQECVDCCEALTGFLQTQACKVQCIPLHQLEEELAVESDETADG